jgi:hypothetical protein
MGWTDANMAIVLQTQPMKVSRIWGTPKSSILDWEFPYFPSTKTCFLGVPPFMKTPKRRDRNRTKHMLVDRLTVISYPPETTMNVDNKNWW